MNGRVTADDVREDIDTLEGAQELLNETKAHLHHLQQELDRLEYRVDSERSSLSSQLRRISVPFPSREPERASISPQNHMRRGDGYGYMEARRANGKQNSLQNYIRRRDEKQREVSLVESKKEAITQLIIEFHRDGN